MPSNPRGRALRPFLVLSIPVAVALLIPVVFLAIRAAEGNAAGAWALLARPRTLTLTVNTLLLVVGVVAANSVIALPLAWLLSRRRVAAVRLLRMLTVLPLAMPGYIVATALLGLSDPSGPIDAMFGHTLPRPRGLFGAILALSMYTYPFLFIPVRAGLAAADPSLDEAARALGASRFRRIRHVVWPTMRTGFVAGALVVALYVVADFGVVSLMRFETYSFAIYQQVVGAYDRVYAAALSLVQVGLTAMFLLFEFRTRDGRRLDRAGLMSVPRDRGVRRNRDRALTWVLVPLVAFVNLGLPVIVLTYWWQRDAASVDGSDILSATLHSLQVAIPAAALAVLIAIPVAALQRPPVSRTAEFLKRLTYLGFATPALAFGLGVMAFALRVVPDLYQTKLLLVIALAIHTLAPTQGPIEAAMASLTPRLDEVAATFGHGPLRRLRSLHIPLTRGALVSAFLLALLLIVKELPLTLLLAPPGFDSLSMNTYSFAAEALFAPAAAHALTIVAVAAVLVALLLRMAPE